MKIETQTVALWATPYGISPSDILLHAENGTLNASQLTILPINQNMSSTGWALMGHAEMSITLDKKESIVSTQVELLREKILIEKENSDIKINGLMGQIQSLLAINGESSLINQDEK